MQLTQKRLPQCLAVKKRTRTPYAYGSLLDATGDEREQGRGGTGGTDEKGRRRGKGRKGRREGGKEGNLQWCLLKRKVKRSEQLWHRSLYALGLTEK